LDPLPIQEWRLSDPSFDLLLKEIHLRMIAFLILNMIVSHFLIQCLFIDQFEGLGSQQVYPHRLECLYYNI
jgi:hypothetical protein